MNTEYRGSLLFVEDDDQQRDLVLEYLKSNIAVDIVGVANGHEALVEIESRYPDAILADVMMPGMSGIDLLRRVREEGLDAPFILMTGFMSPAHLRSALQLGASCFLEKPYDMGTLLETVRAAITVGSTLKRIALDIETLCSAPNVSGADLVRLRDAHESLHRAKQSMWMFDEHQTHALFKAKKSSSF